MKWLPASQKHYCALELWAIAFDTQTKTDTNINTHDPNYQIRLVHFRIKTAAVC